MIPESDKSVFAVVTSGEHKAHAIAAHFPDHRVLWVRPQDPYENQLGKDIPHVRERSALIAAQKAKQWGDRADFPAVPLALFNDVVQFAPEIDYVLERPRDYKHWLDQMMIQSGREIWISAAHVARKMDPLGSKSTAQTVVVEALLRARNFKKPEVREFAEHIGIDNMMDCAGGLPVQLAGEFFDKTSPVLIRYFANPLLTDPPIQLNEVPWENMNGTVLRSLATGAHREPLQHLVNAVQ